MKKLALAITSTAALTLVFAVSAAVRAQPPGPPPENTKNQAIDCTAVESIGGKSFGLAINLLGPENGPQSGTYGPDTVVPQAQTGTRGEAVTNFLGDCVHNDPS